MVLGLVLVLGLIRVRVRVRATVRMPTEDIPNAYRSFVDIPKLVRDKRDTRLFTNTDICIGAQ